MNKNEGFTDFGDISGIDPAVEALIGNVERRQSEARLPKNERSKKKKERERDKARGPNRLHLDLPANLKKRLEKLALREGVPVSQLVAFLLLEPVELLEQKATSLWGYKKASNCPKFTSCLDLERRANEVSRET